MLCDHVAVTLVQSYCIELHAAASPEVDLWLGVYLAMRAVGRVTLPLFCFVLVEGFVHTRSRRKYALRLLLFALVSQLPFDYMLRLDFSYARYLNIMFTLLLSFCALWLGESAGTRLGLPRWGTMALVGAVVFGAGMLADVLSMGYGSYCVYIIGALYLARGHRLAQFALGCALTVLTCRFDWGDVQMWAVVGFALIALYNGERGRGMKWFFYLFYPVHMLVLGLLDHWLF